MFIKVIVPTPMEHPGFKEYYFEATNTNWLDQYRQIAPEPPRGAAFDKATRVTHAIWKQSFLDWFRVQPGVVAIKFFEI